MEALNLKQMILDNMTWQEAKEIIIESIFDTLYSDMYRFGKQESKIVDENICCKYVHYTDFKGNEHEIEVELTVSELLKVAVGSTKNKKEK